MRSAAAVQKNDWLGISWRRPKLVKTWRTTADRNGRGIKEVEEVHAACLLDRLPPALMTRGAVFPNSDGERCPQSTQPWIN